jgi:hypothetical protein
MINKLSFLLALLWALAGEARGVVDEMSASRVRGAARKLNHIVRNSPNASAQKKSTKKDSGDAVDDGGDSNGDESDGGQLSLLPRWFDLLRPCKLLEDQFRGSINCETMLLIPLLIERQVKVEIYTDELCDPLTRRICTTPGFEVIVDFDDQYLTKNVFFADVSIGPINVGTLNFGFDVCLGEDEPVNESNATNTFAESASLCGCEVSLADYPCNSCEFCENGGVSFDCSNIVVGLTNNGSCDTLPRPQSILGDSEKLDVSFPDFLLNMKL